MTFPVRFLPSNRSWHSPAPIDLAAAAAECDLLVERPCGSRSACGKCRVRVIDGAPPATAAERRALGGEVDDGWRLACELVLDGPATVQVPSTPASPGTHGFGGEVAFPQPFSAADPELMRIARACGVPARGIAFDVGTTTVAATLVDLETGRVLATATALNPQVRFGADVAARVRHAREQPGGAAELRDAVLRRLRSLLRDCAFAAGVKVEHVISAAFVGNPTMMQSLLDRHLNRLGGVHRSIRGSWNGPAEDLALGMPAWARAYVVPPIHGHVGADTVASLVAAGVDETDCPTLLLDIGTHCELALAVNGTITCAATTAGPALDGARISHGMRAVAGAIDRVRVRPDGSVSVHAVGGTVPVGLCGSGLVDAIAELLRAGIIDPSGSIRDGATVAAFLPAAAGRIVPSPDGRGRAVRLTSDRLPGVLLTDADVRQVQLEKASVAAAIAILLERAGIKAGDLDSVLVAASFGSFLRRSSAMAVGLVPPLDRDRIRFVGCTACAGARLVLVDRAARRRAERIAATASYVDLAAQPDFERELIDALGFPVPEVAAVR